MEKNATEIIQKAKELLSKSKTQQALILLKSGYKLQPDDFAIKYMYAQLLGDLSFLKRGDTGLKMRRESVRLLKDLSKSLRVRSADERWKVLRHLYYFSGQHMKNYRLGLAEVSRGNKLGYLSQGIGAGALAIELLNVGKFKRAQSWAKKAEEAWLHLFRIDARQPNRLCHFARSLAIQGRYEEADQSINEAARIAKEPLSAFRHALIEISKIKRTRNKSQS